MCRSKITAFGKVWLVVFVSLGSVMSAQDLVAVENHTASVSASSGSTSASVISERPWDPALGTVSVTELQHPLSEKGRSILLKAQTALEAGKLPECLQDLDKAMKVSSAVPYVYGLRGAAYLSAGDAARALPDLQRAVQVMPLPGNISNLGYAYLLSGERELGEQMVRRALGFPNAPTQARYLMGLLLLDRKSQLNEACDDLDRARNLTPSVHMALAVCYERNGMEDASNLEIRELLGIARAPMFDFWKHWVASVAAQPHPSAVLGLHVASAPTAQR